MTIFKNIQFHAVSFALILALVIGTRDVHSENQESTERFGEYNTVNLSDPPPLFQHIQSRLQEVSYFRAEFTEEKSLEALSRTIQNKGFVLFARDRGLFRQVTEPFSKKQLITDKGLVIEKTPEGTRRRKLEPGSAPRQFLDALYLVFSGNFDDFQDRFQVELKVTPASDSGNTSSPEWYLRLTPADGRMEKFFSRMIIEGRGNGLTSFTLEKQNGDSTHTTFTRQSYPDSLSEKQTSKFRSMKSAH